MGGRLTIKGHQTSVWSDENVLFLDSGDYVALYVCQNVQKCIPTKGEFCQCKL